MKSKLIFIAGLLFLIASYGNSLQAETQAASMKTYKNADFHLSFSYPLDWNVVVSSEKPDFLILLLYQGSPKTAGQEDLKIEAYKNSKRGDDNTDQDAGGVKYNAIITLGQTSWKVFNEPLHPTKNTIPLLFLRQVQNSILYVVGAANKTTLNPVQAQIVSSFRFE